MIKNYLLENLKTTDFREVAKAVLEIQAEAFPKVDASMISQLFEDVTAIFKGTFWNYQAMDTVYHDLEHTLQVTLCWVRMVANRNQLQIDPVMTDQDFIIGLHGVLLHDIGFLKEIGDHEGTGAKFTFVHEKRSCELAYLYLDKKGWSKQDISAVQHLISCTGPRSIIDAVPFNNKLERIMGESVCSADYIGQMSDPAYLHKLPALFLEFEESDNYRNIPAEKRMFKSTEELFRGTPIFWEKLVIPKLEKECHGLYKYLAQPFPDGINPYLKKIEEHVNIIQKESKNLNQWNKYFGKRSLKVESN